MIAHLQGTLSECELTEAVIDVNGVGYAVSIPMSTYDTFPPLGQTLKLFTHQHVREDALQLFGFATHEERALFRLLITVSGVGPKLALNILSSMTVQAFCQTIMAEDLKALGKISGIGKRSAERLVVELREKVANIAPGTAFSMKENSGAGKTVGSPEAQDAISALETLGFKTDSARKAVQRLIEESPERTLSAENLIRKALNLLNS